MTFGLFRIKELSVIERGPCYIVVDKERFDFNLKTTGSFELFWNKLPKCQENWLHRESTIVEKRNSK